MNGEKIIILDRDGVINVDSDAFIKSPDEWHAIPGSLEAIGMLSKAGYKVYILTNQSGIARGYFSESTLTKIHEKLHTQAAKYDGVIDGIYYCPHGPNDQCDCRKPLAGLYQQLAQEKGIPSFTNIISIGDSIRDLQAAQTAGATPILVKTGKGLKSIDNLKKNKEGLQHVKCYDSLAEYASLLLNSSIHL